MKPETPSSGWADMTAREHVFPVRVYYEDTDAGGIVYHANYLKFAERARTEMLRLLGHDQFDLLAQEEIGFTVRRCEVDYLAPARLDDALEVRTRLIDVRGASLKLAQTVQPGRNRAGATHVASCLYAPIGTPGTPAGSDPVRPRNSCQARLGRRRNSESLQHGSLD